MKTIILLAFTAALGLGSCQKNYVCQCEETFEADSFHGVYSEDIMASKKNKQSKCDQYMKENYQKYHESTFTCTVN